MPTEMHAFLKERRDEVMERWKAKVRESLPSEERLTNEQLQDSLPLFLDEVLGGLQHMSGKLLDDKRSALARGHGSQRHVYGSSISELVREYGLLYEVVVEIPVEHGLALSKDALVALSKCLFTGAAEAVKEFAHREQTTRRDADLKHFGFIAHELRTPLQSARMAWDAVRRKLTFTAMAVDVLSRSLSRLSELIEETLASARLAELGRAPTAHLESVLVEKALLDVVEDSRGDAENQQVGLSVEPTPGLVVRADPRLLLSALTNLVRNAIKFTHAGGAVVLRSRTNGPRVLIAVQDQCGGLPPERAERLFEAFTQASENRTGFGLGLAIAKQAAEAQGGTISVTNVPNSGCIFELDLPSQEERP